MRRRRRDLGQQRAASAALLLLAVILRPAGVSSTPDSGIHFDPDTNSYSGLTFTFDPRLDKRVEWLHFEHWLSLLQHSSGLLYEALNGRAHLAEVRVLIPYKWRQFEWPVLHKPGVPIIMNRRLRYSDSDVIVGFEDPNYKETPFAIQHDECARQGLNIHMPISFLLDQNQPLEAKLKARQFVREFAAHRYGIFKESGFRADSMYPPFTSLAGFSARQVAKQANATRTQQQLAAALVTADSLPIVASNGSTSGVHWSSQEQAAEIRGFDENWNECPFDTVLGSGLPTPQAAACAPYLARPAGQTTAAQGEQQQQPLPPGTPTTFNLMSADPFSYAELGSLASGASRLSGAKLASSAQPLEWRELAEQAKWRFCGDNFVPAVEPALQRAGQAATAATELGAAELRQPVARPQSFAHNQLAANKQNVMCNERSALDVIKASEDFRRTPFSPSTFNRLPAPTFRFLQEMPPRLILCVEYAAHLYQSRRLDHGILEAAIAKLLALDLVADSELALVLFGQQHATRSAFKRLDSSLEARLTLYSPPIDPFDEPARLYTEQELAQLGLQAHAGAKLVKGSCSFARLMAEVMALQQRGQYDDVGADIVVLTSGLFVEDEAKIEELLRAHFRSDQLQLQLIVYPSAMLFDTKSRDGFVVLDALESEAIVRSRISKLLLIQRLAGAKVHLVREHLDANGDVKMSTLVQFYQIFEHISRGHSWDQTHALTMIGQQAVETRTQANGSKLSFQFELDSSVQHELIVGFIDPKQQPQSRPGKRFAIRNLQLRSPGGHLVLSDSQPWPASGTSAAGAASAVIQLANLRDGVQADEPTAAQADEPSGAAGDAQLATGAESALFPYRTQLGLAGFHLKAGHLAQLNGSQRLAGVWTLTATSDEPLATVGLAMARVNPSGDTVTANCWIQTYYTEQWDEQSSEPSGLKTVKVFAQTRAGAQAGQAQEVSARMEVQDEMGNIVQNVNMLDDGLGTVDMTRGDGVHSQLVQRAHRPGFYKVTVEILGAQESGARHLRPSHGGASGQGQQRPASSVGARDNVCCGSSVPQREQPDTRHLSRQLYCGTFHVDASNKLGQQRPPRVTNLTVANVDQENRRVTIRWFEPQVDIAVHVAQASARLQAAQDGTLEQQDTVDLAPATAERLRAKGRHEESLSASSIADQADLAALESVTASGQQRSGSGAANLGRGLLLAEQAPLSSRYEIKLFSDRDAVRRAFDARQEVGFKFNDWNVEGAFANASTYGGLKELSLRIPFGREGVYYIAMRVYNNVGAGSQLSNIAQFWIRNNLTADEAELLYGQASTVDAEGNVYDRNGELLQRAGRPLNYSLLRGTSSLDGLSILVFVSVAAFVLSVVCVGLVACLASSARNSLGKGHPKAEDKKAVTAGSAITGAGSGSSVVSSGCGSSQQSEVASSAGGSQGGHDVDINKLALVGDELAAYGNIQHRQRQQQLIQAHMFAGEQQQQAANSQFGHYQPDPMQQQQLADHYQCQRFTASPTMADNSHKQSQWLRHTMVNGFAYATVNPGGNGLPEAPSPSDGATSQRGTPLGATTMSPVQSWSADILLSHYDKVRQARERNEAPPVMRMEALEHQGQFADALPALDELQQQAGGANPADQSYLVRQQRNQASSYFNQQLQQQLSSVLKSKQRHHLAPDERPASIGRSSPALEGVTGDTLEQLEPTYGQLQCGLFDHQVAPPPPQYVYCDNGLGRHQLEPSLYSQTTNLQQVSSADALASAGYYANQWPPAASSIYSPQAEQYQQQQQQQQQLPAMDFAGADKPNSAISEV